MSLFEDENYIYRDTFFVYLKQDRCPTASQMNDCLAAMGDKYQISGLHERDGGFGSVTIKSPQDSSAMDVAFVTGDEVLEQIHDMMLDFRTMTLTGDDQKKLAAFQDCNARFDVFHFEEQSGGGGAGPDEILDPGGLLLVMERLAELTGGVGIDPQSQTLL